MAFSNSAYNKSLERTRLRRATQLSRSVSTETRMIYYFYAAENTPELRAIAPDWQGRVADYACMRSDVAQKLVEAEGIHVMGWRPIRDAMRVAIS